tara:strand:+ start:157 stop:438 length:282 start_codon:yes stop_codon:yes gene_type:complete
MKAEIQRKLIAEVNRLLEELDWWKGSAAEQAQLYEEGRAILYAEVRKLRSEVEYLEKYLTIVEVYDGCFAPEDHTSQWQMLMEAHRIEEEQEE